jgi:lysophospholipase L1-like esterase
MKKMFLLLLVLLLITPSIYAHVIPANDSRITYVGRTLQEGNDVSFDWTGVYFRIAFSGERLAIKVSDTHRNYYNVWIDAPMSDEPHQIITVEGTDTIIELINPAYLKRSRSSVHEVIVQKRTEGEQGKTTIHEIITSSNGKFMQAEPLRARQMEFIGASYDCGYGVDEVSHTAPFKPETENSSRCFPAILARYFGADHVVIAHSGMGVSRNYGSKFDGYHMPDRYLQTFDMDSTQATRWDASKSELAPNITVIYLGGNDFSVSLQPKYEKFRDGYYRLLRSIKDNYGEDHPILCVSSKAHEYLYVYIRDLVASCGMKNVEYMACCPALHLSTDEDLGAAWHPNYIGHQKMSYAFIPYIATMTGWGLQDMPVK